MNDVEKAALSSFKEVSTKFLGNTKDVNYINIMKKKLHFLDSHIHKLTENNGDFSEEQGERYHQDLKEFERRFQGRWGINMLAEY